jgi:PAS domain S-box-containing protein
VEGRASNNAIRFRLLMKSGTPSGSASAGHRRSLAGVWVPYTVAAATLLLTLLIVLYVNSSAREKDQIRFEREAGRVEIAIEKTFENYVTLIRSVAALFAADPVVTREEFREFVGRFGIEEGYSGVLGVGFTRRIDPEHVAAFEELTQREGFEDFRVRPAHPREEIHAIQYIEPMNRRNRVALGYDMFSEPVRRAAMERARDQGSASISGKVVLVQEIDPVKQAGFLVYVPVYSTGSSIPPTVEDRRRKLAGFAYSPFRADDLFSAVLRQEIGSGIRVAVYAGAEEEAALLHRSADAGPEARFRVLRVVDIADAQWTMVVTSGPPFEAASERRWIPWILLGGALIALTLLLLTRSVVANRSRTLQAMDELRDREERFRLVSRATNDAIWDWDLASDRIWWNEGLQTLFGHTPGDTPASWWYDQIHPDDRERVLSAITSVINGSGEIWRDEYRFLRADGTYAQVLDRGWVVRNDRGTGVRMIGAMFDASPILEAEQKLAASERRFRTLVTTTSTIVWRADPTGMVREPMVSWEQFTGQSFEQYAKRGWTEAIHPEDREKAVDTFEEAVRSRKPFRTVYRMLHRSGEYRWVEVSSAPITGDRDEIIEWTGTVVDIHSQRETEQELAYRSQLIRTMAENVTTCLFIMDERGYPSYMNRAAKEVTGYSSIDEIRDRPLHYAVHYLKADGSPYPMEECPIDNASAAVVHLRDQEETFVRKDGTLFPVVYSVAPLTRDGKTIGAVVEARDVTEQRKNEAAVREAAERFRFLAESVPQKIFTATPEGEVDYVNRQWLEYTGLTLEQMSQWSWTALVHPEDVEENLRRWREAVASGQPFQLEHRFRRHDGIYHWHLSRAHPMRDPEGRTVMWVGSNTDIEDQKQTQRTLERLYQEADAANRAKDEFLATVSHELRTPMTAILGWSHLLAVGGVDGETAVEAVETIERAAKSQARLIDDLLDVSRIATGKLHLKFESIYVAPCARSAVQAIAPAADAKDITIETAVDDNPGPRVRADSNRLQQIFWNILSNAVKFTPSGGKIQVKLFTEEGEAVFEVSDTGKGIGPEFLPHVFDRFRQEEHTSTRHYAGLGLGLSIVKQLVEMHGGTVAAHSEGEGRGATFRVSLPIRAVDLDSTGTFRRKQKEAQPPPSIKGVRVLVVDDDDDALRVISTILARHGATVTSASSATEALERWDGAIDVLLTDIAMPDRDGFFLLESLKTDNGRMVVPAIALTALGRTEDTQRLLGAGFRRHLIKPVDPVVLVTAVAEVASQG